MDYTNFISNIAFPIAVCGWFMYRLESLIKKQTAALENNSRLIEMVQLTISSCTLK